MSAQSSISVDSVSPRCTLCTSYFARLNKVAVLFTPRIRSILALLLLVAAGLVLAGCRNIETQQKSGTALTRGTEGEYRMVTYVSPEEYERLTPAERERLNATVGFKVRMPIRGSGSRDASEVDQADLEQAAKDVNRRPRER